MVLNWLTKKFKTDPIWQYPRPKRDFSSIHCPYQDPKGLFSIQSPHQVCWQYPRPKRNFVSIHCTRAKRNLFSIHGSYKDRKGLFSIHSPQSIVPIKTQRLVLEEHMAKWGKTPSQKKAKITKTLQNLQRNSRKQKQKKRDPCSPWRSPQDMTLPLLPLLPLLIKKNKVMVQSCYRGRKEIKDSWHWLYHYRQLVCYRLLPKERNKSRAQGKDSLNLPWNPRKSERRSTGNVLGL